MHHMEPAAPGHQSSSGGLLPAFNGNTKPLKYRDLDELLCHGILCKAARGKRVDAGGKDRRINE
jgi:hypothetical protein